MVVKVEITKDVDFKERRRNIVLYFRVEILEECRMVC